MINLSSLLLFGILGLAHSDNTKYNILVIFGHPGQSHYDVFKPMFKALGENGHNITILSHVKMPKDELKNVRDVSLNMEPLVNILDLDLFKRNHFQRFLETAMIANFADSTCTTSLQSPELQNFLEEDNHFDVILTEFFNTNCFNGLITKYQAPFIGLSSCAMMAWHPQWFGSPINPSYIPSIYMAYVPPMPFLQRAENVLMHLVSTLWYQYFMERPGNELSKLYTGFEPADPYNASLLLVNTHHTLHGARPLTPAIVEVGGIHVADKKPKRLPPNIEKWTNESTEGLIYFCLGSLVKGHTFPKEKLQAFTKVFAELNQRILWKWEVDTMDGQSPNLMLTKWAPQFDILCHPNTVLFITHGGLLGTTEAVHCGVPMIVMPQFGDQPLNAQMVKKTGGGVILELNDATEQSIREALNEALSPKMRTSAKKLSSIFRDRLTSPVDTAIYWIENVAKNKGGEHFRSAAVNMPFYQYFLLDVAVFYFIVLFGVVYLFYLLTKSLFTK